MYNDDASEASENVPRSTFEVYRAEGDILFCKGDFKKALESYDHALELRPEDVGTLVSRSKCYLEMGNPEEALKDAETALSINADFPKAMFQKAEAFYQMGDFENALIFYHRGHQARSELNEFRIGIQKSQEAIENAIGDPEVCKLAKVGDLTFFEQEDKAPLKAPPPSNRVSRANTNAKAKPAPKKDKAAPKSIAGDKSVRQLLGELYDDRIYLEKLLNDEVVVGNKTRSGPRIRDLCVDMINYLDSRTEFWRQQKPLYARKADREKLKSGHSSPTSSKVSNAFMKHCVKTLEEMDDLLVREQFEDCLKLAVRLEKQVNDHNIHQLPSKFEILANIYSCMGSAHFEQGHYTQALDYYQRDYNLGMEQELPDAKSRAIDNRGRVYAAIGQHQKAIDVWKEKLPLSNRTQIETRLENSWLYHEMGRCYLELRDGEQALECGDMCLHHATAAEDHMWQLNAQVLIGEAQLLLERLEDATATLDIAHQLAQTLEDDEACIIIRKALDQLAHKLQNQNTKRSTKDVRKQEAKPDGAEDYEDQNDEGRSEQLSPDPNALPVQWKIRIRTAGDIGGGTDANVFVVIHFSDGFASSKTQLDNIDDNFESGRIDEFPLTLPDHGAVTRLQISHDGTGVGSAWKLDYVELQRLDNKLSYRFVCNEWLDKDHGTSRDLYPQ